MLRVAKQTQAVVYHTPKPKRHAAGKVLLGTLRFYLAPQLSLRPGQVSKAPGDVAGAVVPVIIAIYWGVMRSNSYATPM